MSALGSAKQIAAILLITTMPATAAEIEIGPGDDLEATIDALSPGDTLILRGNEGTYTVTSRFDITLTGTAQQPITIRAKAGETPVIMRPDQNQNIVDVENSAHLSFSGLEFTGGSRGFRINNSSFITLEDCHIHHTGDAALTANDAGSTYERLRLLRNHIHHTGGAGEGMYLGCNNNGCQMHSSLVEGNYIHDLDDPAIFQGDGIEIKEGSWGNTVRDNVIHGTKYPCITTYSTVGNGLQNIIERNLMWDCGNHGIQSAADAVIRNNIILGAADDGIRNQPHQAGTPSNLVIVHNTVLAPANSAIRSQDITGSVVIANNALYAQSGAAIQVAGNLTDVVVTGNVGVGNLVGVGAGFDGGGNLGTDLVAANYSGALPQDVFPASGSLLVGAADPTWVADDDFNLISRAGIADAGAYLYHPDGNSGWPLTAGFKPTGGIFADGFESGDTTPWSLSVE